MAIEPMRTGKCRSPEQMRKDFERVAQMLREHAERTGRADLSTDEMYAVVMGDKPSTAPAYRLAVYCFGRYKRGALARIREASGLVVRPVGKVGHLRKRWLESAERSCLHCGETLARKVFYASVEPQSVFEARKYCSRLCSKADQRGRRITADNVSYGGAHRWARTLCPPGPCASCGKDGKTEVHHKNRNWRDNSLGNLERLCQPCHIKVHRPKRARAA